MAGTGQTTKTLSFGGSGMFKQYGKDDAPGIPVGPNGVLGLSIGFVAVVLVLHIIGKFF
ncbi:Sec61 translocon, beta subunit [Monocercomonoides exilis]|uniref:Sec61 translocon, beta subunit n=1 Tax=Monocercomonoides exilis TaxID=2049356 RepID=UPI003559DB7D|nr:Sec61 translocon, beta subunit [Monocercomonoides exilis]|eukprot:MONOS_16856.1-p1 / transcript=MONOS_16856.1 / gene=MONOS_16856 / organism=Monocercomonoides_exilis_PA203 / gene_product=Sec61 translocon, beta subunit / transcript_product=Sec61 translocon, beta subunit / location=Mono_scaffold00819:1679-2013(+) / protein_length=59 / sequence_SO=supercontig / SO=protein_coding / is_pseudo=false